MTSTLRTRPTDLASALALALALVAVAGCGGHEPSGPLRSSNLIAPEAAHLRELAAGITVGPRAVALKVNLSAARVTHLRLRATGDADTVKIRWHLAEEGRFTPYRALSLSLVGDGAEHLYEVDLRREPYWTGRVTGIELSATGGRVRVASLAAQLGGAAGRVTTLDGISVPTLPSHRRLELTLPEDAPRRARFETRLGLMPRFAQPGVEVRFRAWVEPRGGGAPTTWLDERFAGPELDGWRQVARAVDVPRGGKLVMETTALRTGHELPEGSAVWGAPMLLPEEPAPGPNLVLVVIDTLRADVVGAYGGPADVTPALDALAARSIRFADLSAAAPWTLPSIATLLTGQPPQVHGAGRRLGTFVPSGLDEAVPTLASTLAAAGFYTTALYNNIYLGTAFGMERGFDEYAFVSKPDDVLVDRAIARLGELGDRRHFLFLHLFGPHQPYEPPAPLCEQMARPLDPDYAGDVGCEHIRKDVPMLGGDLPPAADRRWIEGLYRGDVANTDRQLGRLLDALAASPQADRTVLLVVADHGEAFWDRLDQMQRFGYVVSDHGHTHYQELLHVPALLAVPGRPAGVIAESVEMGDLFPTLLDLLGVDGPSTPGRDLVPLLAGRAEAAAPPAGDERLLLSDFLLYGPDRWAVRRGSWKLVVPTKADLPVELYDLAHDPGEVHDLAAERPGVVATLRRFGERELRAREAARRKLRAGEEEVVESTHLEWTHITKLRALGYVK